MSVRRERRRDPATGNERWFWMIDIDWKQPNGTERTRVRKVAQIQTKAAARDEERQIRLELLAGTYGVVKEMPNFHEWFHGRFWQEWIVARKNKPSEIRSKKIIYRCHLEKTIGPLKLDEIDVGVVARLKAALIEKKLSGKRINNVLAVLSKPLHYAVDAEVLVKVPKIGMYKVERPEIVFWEFEEYGRILASARQEGEEWYIAVLLAGDAGFRVGEIKALDWTTDVDLVAGTMTVNRQTRNNETGTPKGRTRRTIPMTARLQAALKSLPQIRTGLVVRNMDGSAKSDGEADCAIQRICRRAGLPVRYWHVLRHTFGTHSAQFGVNPWRLQAWMGHKRIEETMGYVHVASTHTREIPADVLAAGAAEQDPDRKITRMLGARGNLTATAAAGDRKAGRGAAS